MRFTHTTVAVVALRRSWYSRGLGLLRIQSRVGCLAARVLPCPALQAAGWVLSAIALADLKAWLQQWLLGRLPRCAESSQIEHRQTSCTCELLQTAFTSACISRQMQCRTAPAVQPSKEFWNRWPFAGPCIPPSSTAPWSIRCCCWILLAEQVSALSCHTCNLGSQHIATWPVLIVVQGQSCMTVCCICLQAYKSRHVHHAHTCCGHEAACTKAQLLCGICMQCIVQSKPMKVLTYWTQMLQADSS